MKKRQKRLAASLGALATVVLGLALAPPAQAATGCQYMFCAQGCYQGDCSDGCSQACYKDVCKAGGQKDTGCLYDE